LKWVNSNLPSNNWIANTLKSLVRLMCLTQLEWTLLLVINFSFQVEL
jgi:hypothetical protein